MHVYSDKWQPPRRVATSLYGLIHDKSIWSDHVTAVIVSQFTWTLSGFNSFCLITWRQTPTVGTIDFLNKWTFEKIFWKCVSEKVHLKMPYLNFKQLNSKWMHRWLFSNYNFSMWWILKVFRMVSPITKYNIMAGICSVEVVKHHERTCSCIVRHVSLQVQCVSMNSALLGMWRMQHRMDLAWTWKAFSPSLRPSFTKRTTSLGLTSPLEEPQQPDDNSWV